MNVYTIIEYNMDDDYVQGIYATKELAQSAMESLNAMDFAHWHAELTSWYDDDPEFTEPTKEDVEGHMDHRVIREYPLITELPTSQHRITVT